MSLPLLFSCLCTAYMEHPSTLCPLSIPLTGLFPLSKLLSFDFHPFLIIQPIRVIQVRVEASVSYLPLCDLMLGGPFFSSSSSNCSSSGFISTTAKSWLEESISQHGATVPSPSSCIFFLPLLLLCSLSPQGGNINVPSRAAQSILTFSHQFDKS